MSTTSPTLSEPRSSSLADWRKAAAHTIQLPSSTWVKIRIPDLSTLVARNLVPDTLKRIAAQAFLRDVKLETGVEEAPLNIETLGQLADLNYWLVSWMLVEPEVSAEDVRDLPAEDLELLVSIAQRETDVDARGVPLGVVPLARFRGAGVDDRLGADRPASPDDPDAAVPSASGMGV